MNLSRPRATLFPPLIPLRRALRSPVLFGMGLLSAASALGCEEDCDGCAGNSGDAALSVLLEAEDVITDGLSPGPDLDNIKDGWQVNFDKYLVAIGGIELRLSTDTSVTAVAQETYIVDLTQLSARGLALWDLDGLADGRWEFNFSLSPKDAVRHESVSAEDFSLMEAEGFTYLVSGALSQEGGVSCPPTALSEPGSSAALAGKNSAGDQCYAQPHIEFSFGLLGDASLGPCEIDGLSGVVLSPEQTSSAAITLHGDHLFFNGFPEGSEGGVMRLAQWLADCDLNLDGQVTAAELEKIRPSDLNEIDERFQLGGSPITPLSNMLTYLEAQGVTQGHFQGEGECALRSVGEN